MNMTEIIIDRKKYVLISEKDYRVLQRKAALKTGMDEVFTIEKARAYSKKLIREWAKGV